MTLPSSTEFEKGLLCSLLNPERSSQVMGMCLSKQIGAGHFILPAHQKIFESVSRLHRREDPVDLITVTNDLRDHGLLEDCGGAPYVTDLFTYGGLPANAEAYSAALEEKRRVRAAMALSTRIRGDLESPIPDFPEWVSKLIEEASSLQGHSGKLKSPVQLAREFYHFYEQLEGGLPMVSCGLDAIDLNAGPFMRGDMVVISGVTGGGKSALVNSFIDRSIDLDQCAAVFTLEMSDIQYLERIASSRGGVNMHSIRQRLFKKQPINEGEYRRISTAVDAYSKSQVYIVNDVTDLNDLTAKCLQIQAKRQLDIIVLDYAQLLSSSGDTREREVASVSQGMKRLAMKLKCVAIVLSQLNDDGRLRESRAIGHDANVVLNIERDEHSTWIKVSKGRSCASGTKIPLKWVPEFTKFENMADAL